VVAGRSERLNDQSFDIPTIYTQATGLNVQIQRSSNVLVHVCVVVDETNEIPRFLATLIDLPAVGNSGFAFTLPCKISSPDVAHDFRLPESRGA